MAISTISSAGLADGAVGASQIASGGITSTQLATAVQPIGVGQTWQDFTASRAAGTTYTNSTGRPIFVSVNSSQASYTYTRATVGGVALPQQGSGAAGYSQFSSVWFVVPSGSTYSVSFTNGTLLQWAELR